MTLLRTMADQEPNTALVESTDPAVIAEHLAGLGITYERWTADRPPAETAETAGTAQVLAAYRDDIDRLCTAGGYLLVDVARMRRTGDDPAWPAKAAAARGEFREEHRHDEDEVRFFVEGRGCFYLHIDGLVHAVVCEAGDLLSVPAGVAHWFDMGAEPCFTAIRFFQQEDGWVADLAADSIAARFPDLERIMAGHE